MKVITSYFFPAVCSGYHCLVLFLHYTCYASVHMHKRRHTVVCSCVCLSVCVCLLLG